MHRRICLVFDETFCLEVHSLAGGVQTVSEQVGVLRARPIEAAEVEQVFVAVGLEGLLDGLGALGGLQRGLSGAGSEGPLTRVKKWGQAPGNTPLLAL